MGVIISRKSVNTDYVRFRTENSGKMLTVLLQVQVSLRVPFEQASLLQRNANAHPPRRTVSQSGPNHMSAISPVYSNHYQIFYTSKTSLTSGLEHFTTSRVRLRDLGFRNTEGTMVRPGRQVGTFYGRQSNNAKTFVTVGVFYRRYFAVLTTASSRTVYRHQSQPLMADGKQGRQCTLV